MSIGKPLLANTELFAIHNHKPEAMEFAVFSEQYFQLTLVTGVSGKRVVGSSIEEFRVMDLVLIPPNVHCRWLFKEKTEAGSIRIVFDDCFSKQALFEKTYFRGIRQLLYSSSSFYVFSEAELPVLQTKINELCMHCRSGFDSYIHFFSLLDCLSQSSYRKEAFFCAIDHRDNRIRTIYQYIQEHFREDISLEEIASVARMSPKAFCRYFKQQTQMSFLNYLYQIQVKEALVLLQDVSETIAGVGYACGFKTPSSFRRVFEKVMKMTPGEYRKEACQNGSHSKC